MWGLEERGRGDARLFLSGCGVAVGGSVWGGPVNVDVTFIRS